MVSLAEIGHVTFAATQLTKAIGHKSFWIRSPWQIENRIGCQARIFEQSLVSNIPFENTSIRIFVYCTWRVLWRSSDTRCAHGGFTFPANFRRQNGGELWEKSLVDREICTIYPFWKKESGWMEGITGPFEHPQRCRISFRMRKYLFLTCQPYFTLLHNLP